MTDELLTADEAMRRLEVSRRTLDRYVERGLLTAIQRSPRGPRRFLERDVEAVRRGECPRCHRPLTEHDDTGWCLPPL